MQISVVSGALVVSVYLLIVPCIVLIFPVFQLGVNGVKLTFGNRLCIMLYTQHASTSLDNQREA